VPIFISQQVWQFSQRTQRDTVVDRDVALCGLLFALFEVDVSNGQAVLLVEVIGDLAGQGGLADPRLPAVRSVSSRLRSPWSAEESWGYGRV
jgi:hypothetical protein